MSNFEPNFFHNFNFIRMPPIVGLDAVWNGSHLGAIDDYIFSFKKVEYEDIIYLWVNIKGVPKMMEVRLLKFKNEIPLICDSFKSLFNIPQTGMHRGTLKGEECLLQKAVGDIPLEVYINKIGRKKVNPGVTKEIQRLFAFRWLMCINCNYENKIDVRNSEGLNYPISCKEFKYSLNAENNACRIPKTVLKEWFENSEELLSEIILELVEDKDPNYLKIEILKIISIYNSKYIPWANSIFDKVLQLV